MYSAFKQAKLTWTQPSELASCYFCNKDKTLFNTTFNIHFCRLCYNEVVTGEFGDKMVEFLTDYLWNRGDCRLSPVEHKGTIKRGLWYYSQEEVTLHYPLMKPLLKDKLLCSVCQTDLLEDILQSSHSNPLYYVAYGSETSNLILSCQECYDLGNHPVKKSIDFFWNCYFDGESRERDRIVRRDEYEDKLEVITGLFESL